MLCKIGGTIVAFGIMCADSRDLFIPISIVLLGMLLVVIGERRSDNE